MRKSEWNDKQLEDLLRHMPKVDDDRHPQDIYQSISSKIEKRKKRTWIVPAFASSVAILLLLILTPDLLQQNKQLSFDENKENIEEIASSEMEEPRMRDENEVPQAETKRDEVDIIDIQSEDNPIGLASSEARDMLTAVYEEDLAAFDRLSYAIPDQMAQNVIPLTVLIEKDSQTKWFDQFIRTGPLLTEEAWGLGGYFPLNATVTFDESKEIIHVDVPEDHLYGQGSASYMIFIHALEETFASQPGKINTIQFTTGNERGFDGHGDYVEELSIKPLKNRAYYLYTPVKGEKPYFVPFTKLYDSITDALIDMKEPIKTHELTSAIPERVTIAEVRSEKGTLHVALTADSQLENNKQAIYFIESLLLTAKEFGYDWLMLENTPITEVGPFSLEKRLKIPVGANKQIIIEDHSN